MALITTAATASLDASTAMYAPQVSGLLAGENIALMAPCYIKSSDGKVYQCDASADNEAAEFVGVCPRAANANEPVTLFGLGTRFKLATGLTPGDILYVGATAGQWDNTATAGDPNGTLQIVTSTDVRVARSSVKPTIAEVGAGAIGTSELAAGAVTKAKAAVFISSEQTGTGSAQNIAHGLGATPAGVLIVPTDTAPATAGDYTATEGAHSSTNVVITVTSGKKYKVFAWA